MNNEGSYEKYLEVLGQRIELENNLKKFIEKCKQGKSVFDQKTIDDTINKGNIRLERLKKEEQELHTAYMQQEIKETKKRNGDIVVSSQFGVHPSNIKVVGGVLSNIASESHLTGEKKTKEELLTEKKDLLAHVRNEVNNNELDLSQASSMVNAINNSYNFYEDNKNNLTPHR